MLLLISNILFSVVFLQINFPLFAWLSGERACSYYQKQILPNCTSACSLSISLNKWHPFSSHMAQLVCNANTQGTLASSSLRIHFQRCVWKLPCGAMLCRYRAGLGHIRKACFEPSDEWNQDTKPQYQIIFSVFMLDEVCEEEGVLWLGWKCHNASWITVLEKTASGVATILLLNNYNLLIVCYAAIRSQQFVQRSESTVFASNPSHSNQNILYLDANLSNLWLDNSAWIFMGREKCWAWYIS